MYKVMIVDDEILVRVGLKSTIDWESLGFTVVAEASNGEQALELFKQHNADVVLTDIRMPKKDGLWLLETIKKDRPSVKVLMLTCYDDFAYAREALKLGAFNYILKSEVEDEELIRIMKDLKENLDSESKRHDKNSYLQIQINTNLNTLKEKLLDDLVRSNIKANEAVESRCQELGINTNGKQFLLLQLCREDTERNQSFTDKDWQLMNFAIINISLEILNELNYSYLSKTEDNGCIMLLAGDKISNREILPYLKKISAAVQQYLSIPLSIVSSHMYTDIRLTGKNYEELHKKSQLLFYKDENGIIYSDDNEPGMINIVEIKKNFEQKLLHYLEEEDIKNALSQVDHMESYFKQNLFIPIEVRIFYSNLISNIFEYYNNRFSSNEEVFTQNKGYSRIMKVPHIKDITSIVKEHMLALAKQLENYRLKNSNSIILKARDYIHKHYSEEISLQSLAQHLNLSKHYVCYLFKKETGENISAYLNKYRIEKAKLLVLESNYKIKEIYDRLGFSDQQYFCKIFKKVTGMTVVQYRDSMLKKAEVLKN